jgi:uncharacterized protein (TIGR02453 family)
MIALSPLLTFLSELQANNNKAWMDAHRTDYYRVRDTVRLLTEKLLLRLPQLDPALGTLMTKDCIFRINRDIRFSNDKRPYKSNMGAYFAKGGKKSLYAGYYLHLRPSDRSFIAGGIYQPDAAVLKQIRQEIDYNGSDLQAIVQHPSFQQYFGDLQGPSLLRPPRGYDAQHPYINWLKLKSFVALHPLSDEQVLESNFVNYTLKVFTCLKPFIDFLNQAVGDLE